MSVATYHFSRVKRVFDILVSLFILVGSFPLLLVIGVGVLLTAGWPVFYIQGRWGRNKQPFSIYKFRTMYLGADQDKSRFQHLNQAPAPMFKVSHDPRFVGMGRFLSYSGLDELPQLLNILKGEMSLVGPRPLPISESKKLGHEWDFRYQIKPGIFSEWGAAEKRYTSQKQWRLLDKKTVTHSSLITEVCIIIKTCLKHLGYLLPVYREP